MAAAATSASSAVFAEEVPRFAVYQIEQFIQRCGPRSDPRPDVSVGTIHFLTWDADGSQHRRFPHFLRRVATAVRAVATGARLRTGGNREAVREQPSSRGVRGQKLGRRNIVPSQSDELDVPDDRIEGTAELLAGQQYRASIGGPFRRWSKPSEPREGNHMNATILDRIGNTPLVRLDRVAAGLPVPVYGKCEFLNPGGSIKDRIALAIVDDAERRGLLAPGMTLVEATAGNTGIGLALVAAARGYKLACVLPEKMCTDKRAALAALGAEVIVTANAPPHDPRNFRRVAERLAAERGWFLTNQFGNAANPRVHELTTGPELVAQCAARPGAFVCGAGTGGTITGVGRYLKNKAFGAKIILADPIGSRLAHLVDSRHPDLDAGYKVEGIGGSEPPGVLDLSVIDGAERVSDEESFAMTLRLIREEGLLVGGSSGTAVVAALRIAVRGDVGGPVIAVLADSWDRYFSTPWLKCDQTERGAAID